MTKRPTALDALKLAATGTKKPSKQTETGMMTTAVHIRRDHWELLRRAAFARAAASGGRASVSAVITELVEANRARLEKDGSQ